MDSQLMTQSIVRDPVCGMEVDPAAGKPRHEHGGHVYHFCSEGCRARFAAEPERYLGGAAAPEPMPAGTIYTCPMHPEIEQDGPGDCPICGMALEPKAPAPEPGANPELVDFRRRFAVGAALTVPLLVIAMGPMLGLPVEGGSGHGRRAGRSWRWRRRWCSGAAGRS